LGATVKPERWQQIERLYHAALDREPSHRGVYLQQVCGTDESLRREVEGLLALEQQVQDFIEVPALEIVAQHLAANPPELTVGQTVDRYRILARLGAGGMGIVYTAHDSRLGRTVALKFLLDEFSGEPEALERFRHEARTLSALNHPNICTIYDIGEAEGRTFIAMEYVAGKSLDRLIGRKRLLLNDALKYAVQIADGLAKAHAAGVVHRDLKPGNIMVADEGHVKLLDFGVAKLTKFDLSGESDSDLREAPRTEDGTIFGTVAYMSPEQARGKKLDARSDIFSCGAVLYEMITGRLPFPGEDKVSTMSAILHQEPTPVGQVSQEAPRELERIVARCLRKDPERRFQNAADLKVALQEIKDEFVSGELADGETASLARRVSAPMIAVSTVLLIAIATGIWLLSRTGAKQRSNVVITRLTSDSGLTTNPAISRDGKIIAYASDRSGENNLDIWVQQVAGGQPIRLTSNPADESQPDFSPDGSKVVFRSERGGGGIYVISALGGEERLVVLAKKGFWPRFSPDGKWIAYSEGSLLGTSRIYVVSSTGGPPRELKIQVPWAKAPLWSPDGKYLIFLGSTDQLGFSGHEWWVVQAEGGQAVNTGALAGFERSGLSPAFDTTRVTGQDELYRVAAVPSVWIGDRIIFSCRLADSVNLWQVAIAAKTWQIQDPPQRLTTGSGQEFNPSLAADGRMVFATVDQHLSLWMLPIDANGGKVMGEPQPLTQTAGNSLRPSLSSDGRKLVFVSDRSGNAKIWLRDMESGKETALTATPWDESHPYITADGSKVLYQSLERPNPPIYVLSIGKGVAEKFCDDCGLPMAWSPDGRRIFFHQRETTIGVWHSIDVVTRQRMDVIRHEKYNLHSLRLSPDGNWLAFHVPQYENEGRSPVVIAPLRNGLVGESEWIQASDGSSIEATPWWSPDGSILYFLSKRDGFQCIWAQHLHKATKRPVGPPMDITHFHGARHNLRQVGFGPGAAADKLVFTMSDSTGNVWMTKSEVRK
jgi:eukaryotic-like serine/threonine-protein kinase